MRVRTGLGWIALILTASLVVSQETEEGPAPGERRTDPESGVVATVNGEPVHFEDLERLLASMHRTGGAPAQGREDMDLDRVMFRLVNDALLAQEARALGLQNEDPIPARLERLREELAIARLEREEISSRAQATEEEIRSTFEDDYRTVTFRILTTYERDDADELLAQLREGVDFESLARERSVDQYGPRGGLVEKVAKIDIPRDLAKAAFELEPGGITGPIQTVVGWANIRVESFGDPDRERFDGLERQLRQLVRYRKADALRAALDERLQEAHPVTLDQAALDAIGHKRLQDGRLMPEVDDPDAVVARVGDRTVTAQQYGRALMSAWKGVRNEQAALAAKPIALNRLVRDERMLAEALRRGYGDTESVRRKLRAYETQLVVALYLREIVGAGIEVTDEEAKAAYEAHRTEFRKPPRVHVGQITVAAREEAERLAELLRQGADLAWLARQHSIDRFKDAGGDRGWMVPARGVDPEQDALFNAEVGDVVGPTGVPGNFVVLRVGAREEQGFLDFEQVKSTVRSMVYTEKYKIALDTLIQTLRSRSEVTIHRDVLASLKITGGPIDEDAQAPAAPHGH
jgi:peptidyl-prolyl cis-trans isomerase C